MSKNYYIQLGIAVRIPMAFQRFCDEGVFTLVEKQPENMTQLTEEDQKISLKYLIQDLNKTFVASFHPSGQYECLNEPFRPIFDKIVEELHYAASKASHAQDKIHQRMTEEFERNLTDKSSKNDKFSM